MDAATRTGRTTDRRRTVAAAAVVLSVAGLAVLLVVLARGEGEAVPIDAAGVPEVVHASAAALRAGDYDAWRAVHTPDARLSDGHPLVAESPLRRLLARQGELDFELTVLGCQETSAPDSSTRRFECDVEGSGAIMRAAGVTGQARWTHVLQDGRIIESSPPFFDNGAEIAQAHAAMSAYLREVDRETFQQVCAGGHLDMFDARLGPDCTGFVRGHLDGFAARNDGGTA